MKSKTIRGYEVSLLTAGELKFLKLLDKIANVASKRDGLKNRLNELQNNKEYWKFLCNKFVIGENATYGDLEC